MRCQTSLALTVTGLSRLATSGSRNKGNPNIDETYTSAPRRKHYSCCSSKPHHRPGPIARRCSSSFSTLSDRCLSIVCSLVNGLRRWARGRALELRDGTLCVRRVRINRIDREFLQERIERRGVDAPRDGEVGKAMWILA